MPNNFQTIVVGISTLVAGQTINLGSNLAHTVKGEVEYPNPCDSPFPFHDACCLAGGGRSHQPADLV